MRLRRLLPVLLLLLAALSAVGQIPPGERRLPPEYFEKPERAAWQKPDEIVRALELKPGQNIADIGAASGYFSFRFATAVGPDGIVYAVDLDEKMLRFIQDRAKREKAENIVTVLCPPDNPMLAPHSVDLIFFCDTLHHIRNRPVYYRHLTRALRPGGRLAVVDFQKRKLPVGGPPMSTRISREELINEAAGAGFTLAREFDFLPYQYFQVYRLKS